MTDNTYQQARWTLDALFKVSDDSPEMEAAFEAIDARVAEFEKRREMLNEDMAHVDFMTIIREMEEINYAGRLIHSYAELRFAADTQSQEVLSLMARARETLTKLGNRTMFFSLWWKSLPDEAADRLMKNTGDYTYWLEEIRHFRPHTLSESEEKIINLKDLTGSSALITLYDAITNRYVFNLEIDGEVREMTRGELSVYARHANPELRRAAYQELYRVYGDDGPILGQMYQTLVRDWGIETMDLRSFASPIASRNLANDIPDAVVDTLLAVSERNVGLFQRFFKLKARWLKMEKLHRYDIYAPIGTEDAQRQYDFGEAAEVVLDSFEQFEPRLAELAQRLFDEERIDSQVRKGKRGGAFCMSPVNDLTPWVLVNYQGNSEDVATLAHELGHAIHSLLANDHNLFTFHASLPLAETASTFAEMMLVDRLLAEEKDDAVRRDLLFRQVDDAYATIMRQTYFALFERQAHQVIKEGASVDDLAAAYMENLEQQFGDAVELADEFRWEWVSIPHIYHVPFYVYAYSFGQLLVLSLYQQYKTEGDAFKPRYLKILSAGGSQAPAEILSEAGIDIYDESFWQGGFDVVRDLIEQLESIPID
jgi:oligoendopeptidase F